MTPPPGRPAPSSSTPPLAPRWTFVAAIVLVAANLRTLMASLPPLAEAVRADLGLSSAWMGVLTTLPVLCMGLLAPVANQVARRVGSAVAVGGGLAVILVGVVVRGLGEGAVWSLYTGTLLAGAGIALAGTLLARLPRPAPETIGTPETTMGLSNGQAVRSGQSALRDA